MTDTDPLIVTALFDAASQDELDARRRRWFPAGRRVVGAHLTLFHALPGARVGEVAAALDEVTDRPPIAATIEAPISLGRGVAHPVDAPGLADVHTAIARRFAGDLTRQDQQRLRAHVTVQNKVDPPTARATLAELTATHRPWSATITGLGLWRYRGGPWDAAGEYLFRDAAP
ncbi:2'-5' RNA ligase family protein [Actinomycetospora straminea]|uniref:2'-5' RNA ligase family protein n=1 Tax=Actinomycetospora straminea TaxID=663607 RepID=A0ABP9DVM8_9PSEU|nr:2'-5' RNA ligase family protein [Actinomycetospora straminea]MDD7932338.1 2'-5' RNA ligase family protein [Actinomycetospora straminea]